MCSREFLRSSELAVPRSERLQHRQKPLLSEPRKTRGQKSLRMHINFQKLKSLMVQLNFPVVELGVVRG